MHEFAIFAAAGICGVIGWEFAGWLIKKVGRRHA